MVSTKFTTDPRRNLLDFIVVHLSHTSVDALEFPQRAAPFLLSVSKISLHSVHQMLKELSLSIERYCTSLTPPPAISPHLVLQRFSGGNNGSGRIGRRRRLPCHCRELLRRCVLCGNGCDEDARLTRALMSVKDELAVLQRHYADVEENTRQLLAYFGLSLHSATQLFLELYPPPLGEKRRREQLEREAKKVWSIAQLEQMSTALKDAAEARALHQADPESTGSSPLFVRWLVVC